MPCSAAWLWSAERLFYGEQQLWRLAAEAWSGVSEGSPVRDHPVQAGQFLPAFMLFGYTIENALKGLIVQKRVAARQKMMSDARNSRRGVPVP